jgi:hypothetical protein
MIGKVVRGSNVGGLLRYLYGPGRANEHTDPHLVAGFGDPHELEPDRRADGSPDLRRLAGLLLLPLALDPFGGCEKPVWHCSVRAGPGDRMLSDEEWGQIAAAVMDRTGFARHDDELQPARRSHLGHDAEFVLDTQGEPGHVEVAMAALDVDQQVQVAVGSCLAAGHRAEDPDVAHAKALAETPDRITVCAYLIQCDGTPWGLNLHVPTSSRLPPRIEARTRTAPTADPARPPVPADRNPGRSVPRWFNTCRLTVARPVDKPLTNDQESRSPSPGTGL